MKRKKNQVYSKIAKKISSELEYYIHKNSFRANDISREIGMTEENFSVIRCRMRAGKIPPLKFQFILMKIFQKTFSLKMKKHVEKSLGGS